MPKTPSFILKKIEECRATQAKSLDLHGGEGFGKIRLIAIPPEVFTLTQLESLDLRDNAIQIVPDEIKQLTQLKRLDLRGNPLRQVADVAGLFVHYADFIKLNLPAKNIIGLKLTLFSHDTPAHLFELPNLTALEISKHRLTQIPDWVFKLENLTELDFSNNRLRELSGLETLVNLSSLDLSYNELSSLSGIEKLVNISSLNLSVNELSSLSGIEKLVNISSLNLSVNELSNLSGLEKLVNLFSLNLGYNELSSLSGLETLLNLSSLDLSGNQLRSLSGIENLIELSTLNLSSNQLRSLPRLEKLDKLSSLNLSENWLSNLVGLETLDKLSSLDLSYNPSNNLSGLDALVNLSSLNLSHNQLRWLSIRLEKLVNLYYLDMSHNHLSCLSELEGLVKLSFLNLSFNPLVSLLGLEALDNLFSLDLSATYLSNLPRLEKLDNLYSLALSNNKLSSLSGLETLNNLSSLALSYNRFKSLPKLDTLVNLSSLDLSHNYLQNLSGLETLSNLSYLALNENKLNNLSGLERLLNLSYLDLSSNQFLQIIPEKLFNLPKLETLQLNKTPITYPPIEQLELDNGEVNLFRVHNYLRQLNEEKDYLYEAKLLIVGKEEAGKTSLMRKIKNPTYQVPEQQIPRTEGIDVESWDFPFDEKYQFRVNIWDFGGQEIYHATHQFFLSKRALYILVTENCEEETDVYYWFNVVNSLSDGSPILLVKNEKCDCPHRIDEEEAALREQFQSFEKSYATNLKTNSKDYACLLEDIRHRLKQLPLVGSPQPKKWLDVRAELEQRAKQDNYIELKEYYAICERHGFKNTGDKLHLSETLHDLGTVLHFQKDILLKNTLFLKPEWATQAVYNVLDDKTVQNNYGQFTNDDLKKIWHEAYYEFMHGELLQLMLNFRLCYKLGENTYIAPQLLREQQPQYTFETKDAVTVFYKNYKFMPKGMLSQLIVVLHRDIAECQTLVWRSGVILERHNTRAEIIENYSEREIRIRVVGQDRGYLIHFVIGELNKIHSSYHNLQYEVLLLCGCEEPYLFDFETLREFAADNAPIQCQKRDCRKLPNARDLIEGVLNMKDDNNGKTVFGGNSFRDIHGNVIIQEAGHDAVLNQTRNTI